MPIDQMELGKVIKIGSRLFVKISSENDFMALQKFVRAGFADGMDMQDFTASMCNSVPTPTGTNYFLIGNLVDSRDGKSYEIRKFADGKCWMVDNLMYGGVTDNCAGVDAAGYTNAAYGGVSGRATPSNRFGTGTYGNCRDPRVGGSSPCVAGSTTCGYLYNWQAVMQHSSAYSGSIYTGSTTDVQGICPDGWHLPGSGELGVLHTVAVATYTFWNPGGNWKGVYSGSCGNVNGGLDYQGQRGIYWISDNGGATNAGSLSFYNGRVHLGSSIWDKGVGFPIRCIKD